ncbi:MinD/ParA family protein [Magnetospirillum molischianum]|uniref:ATPase involved in chromosome partitioning n=1 Tax=Magnetospirillum molischianum DSM 120 TaxID=1150626 RepID=H8FUB8_MAGML|nr:MinD/ParA family protein [Magnetospirillum molischianum]CCG41956.1 ATPase involved in chromosome partitioning [Magnetospirillum molischianum DSM 120]
MSTPDAPTLAPHPTVRAKGRNIIAVASGKGGVGKTWFAITLSHALARAGQKILLFDGDLGLANVDIQLGLMPKADLGSVVAGRMTLNQAAVAFGAGGFDVIAGRSGSGTLANIPLSRLQMLGDDLVTLSGGYDRVVVDLGAGVEKSIRTFSQSAGTIMVVTTDEPTSLTDAYAFIKVTSMERPGSDLRVVVNMANSTREGERIYSTLLKACEGFLKISPPLAGVIRRDLKVREAIRNQTPIMTRSPNAEAAADVEAIVERLVSTR